MSDKHAYIVLTFKVWREDRQFVSECLELGVPSCGDTIEEAFHNLEDAVHLYLNSIEEMGDRTRIFKERGIQVRRAKEPHLPPAQVSVDQYVTRHRVKIGASCYA